MNSDSDSAKPIVHIATDEKFINAAYDIYDEAFPGLNEFVILIEGNNTSIKYLSDNKDYTFFYVDDAFPNRIWDKVQRAKIIVFHGMGKNQIVAAHVLRNYEATFIWTVFGREVYNRPLIVGNTSYGAKTYKTYVFSFKKWLNDLLRIPYYKYLKRKVHPQQKAVDVLKNMDFVSILFEEERTNYIRLGAISEKTKFLKFTYYPLDIIINSSRDYKLGHNILLGNSASHTNNHLEAFDILSTLPTGNRNIITPLSYGDDIYATDIAKQGKLLFGDNFKPLIDFMPLTEYQNTLESCGIVVMNHYRQQAVGNVLNTLYMGAKVYLSNKNTLYHYLKRIGCTVYAIEEDLKPQNKSVFSLLPEEVRIKNREILRTELSTERICKELKDNLSALLA